DRERRAAMQTRRQCATSHGKVHVHSARHEVSDTVGHSRASPRLFGRRDKRRERVRLSERALAILPKKRLSHRPPGRASRAPAQPEVLMLALALTDTLMLACALTAVERLAVTHATPPAPTSPTALKVSTVLAATSPMGPLSASVMLTASPQSLM